MTLTALQRLESQLSNAKGILNQQKLCDPDHRQLCDSVRSALQTVMTERILAEIQAARRMIREVTRQPNAAFVAINSGQARVTAVSRRPAEWRARCALLD